MTTPHAVSSYATGADASGAPSLRRGLSPDGKYSGPAIFFHWAIAVLIPVMVGLGWYMMSIEEQPGSPWYFNLHKSLGLTVALLVVTAAGDARSMADNGGEIYPRRTVFTATCCRSRWMAYPT